MERSSLLPGIPLILLGLSAACVGCGQAQASAPRRLAYSNAGCWTEVEGRRTEERLSLSGSDLQAIWDDISARPPAMTRGPESIVSSAGQELVFTSLGPSRGHPLASEKSRRIIGRALAARLRDMASTRWGTITFIPYAWSSTVGAGVRTQPLASQALQNLRSCSADSLDYSESPEWVEITFVMLDKSSSIRVPLGSKIRKAGSPLASVLARAFQNSRAHDSERLGAAGRPASTPKPAAFWMDKGGAN